jgi:hypothetical protein
VGINLISKGRRNKQQGLPLGLDNQKIIVPYLTQMTYRTQPAISLTVSFAK